MVEKSSFYRGQHDFGPPVYKWLCEPRQPSHAGLRAPRSGFRGVATGRRRWQASAVRDGDRRDTLHTVLWMLAQNPPPPPVVVPPGAGGGVADRKRPQWTEADVLALPAGEHDEFDRKSGVLVGQGGFYNNLGKALSAFATSKGGHLVLGVTDKGVLDGVEAVHGTTPTRESA